MLLTDIIGQDHIVNTLRQALKRERIVHGYLFSGPDGLGKRSTAEALAAALLCVKVPLQGCGVCESCQKLIHGNHPDFHRLRSDGSQIGIDEVRELQQALSYEPYMAQFKVALIEDAEKMTTQAANALLKFLEEPVGDAVIILTTNNLSGILPTIVSRCQVYRFHPVSTEILAKVLQARGVNDQEAWDRALEARGITGKALGNPIDGKTWSLPQVAVFSERLLKSNAAWVLHQTEEWGYDAPQAEEFLLALEDWYRMVLIFQATGHSEIKHGRLVDILQSQARQLTGDLLAEIQEHIRRARHALSLHVNVRLILDALCLHIQACAQQASKKGA